MISLDRSFLRVALAVALVGIGSFAEGRAHAATSADSIGASGTAPFTVDGQVALHSFMALSDGHLQELADVLRLLAATEDVRSGQWERIREPLAGVSAITLPAVLWFAEPKGAYWTAHEGRATGNLSDRPYFSRVLGGATVIGDLVVSRSTNRNTAVVAVPVRRDGEVVVGVLGASVHLDSLGAIVRREMGGLEGGLLFFSIDAKPMGAIHSDPSMIFTEPMKLGDEAMRRAFLEILSRTEGVVTYAFRGAPRTMIYRKSPVTGWWYAVGVLRG
ncbi:MAG TPA: cache domain-containing protein [Acidobacteriota bacterium]|nr:cache domain-containing protein [Acidobacteriota bacterium]